MELGLLLIALGGLLLVGLGLDALGRLTHLPRITLLVLFGLAIGPGGFDLLPIDARGWHETVTQLALTMIAFLLGGELSRAALRGHGLAILSISLSISVASLVIIAGGLLAIGAPPVLALLLAGIGLATAPAATRDVTDELGAGGPVTQTILGVVAIDDAWGLIGFSIILGLVAGGVNGGGLGAGLAAGLLDILVSVGIGLAVGLPAAYATGRIRPGRPTLAEALGIVLLCAGLALWLEVSFLIAGMTAGVVVVNLAQHHEHPFHEIEHVSWPFLIVFFVLSGAVFDIAALAGIGVFGLAFVALRLVSRWLGGWAGGRIAGMPAAQARIIGLALTPQAGVALGMALVAAETVPEVADTLLTIAIASTIVFELGGPVLTRLVLRRAGEARRQTAPAPD